ncbi:MAG: hypothetical protein HY787_02795 [Deltaproteobacteria bacterium]|nr:hypothetical protein [Deltaproteobacteria bacterium]
MKTSIKISDDLYQQGKKISNNFSLLVSEALKEYLHKAAVKKAVHSFGTWAKRGKGSVTITNELRNEGNRNYANRVD